MPTTGSHVLLKLLADSGVRYLFGNPGTTELPLMDALVDEPRMQYVLGLQEIPVMAAADGYAQASRQVGFVNLHISCGLGHAMGMLYNAYRAGTPLLVTAGQTDRRLNFQEPILWGEMVRVARPWTKWSAEVQRVEDLPSAVRRAVHAALTPPTGPVFLSIPVDIQAQVAQLPEVEMVAPCPPDPRVRPPQEAVQKAAEVLAAARNPAILVGSRVTECDAVEEMVAVADRLGAPVMSESGTTHGRLSFPATHPLSAPGLPLWSPEVRTRLNEFDVVLVAGMDLLREYVYHEPARAIPEHIRLVQIDQDPYQLGKNFPLEVAVLGHLQPSLAELDTQLAAQMTAAQTAAAAQRGEARREAFRAAREKLKSDLDATRDARPLAPATLMESIARATPDDVAVVEEAVTTTNTMLERLGALKNTSGYFGHRGWALGWGLGCALGVQLAWPERPVLGLLGEGAAMYGIQGLWTAARYRIPVTYVICNNAQYQILKIGAQGMQLPHALEGQFVGLDLNEPEVDIVTIAQGLGIEARRISEPDELTDAVRDSLAGEKPQLFDVPIQRPTPGRLNYG